MDIVSYNGFDIFIIKKVMIMLYSTHIALNAQKIKKYIYSNEGLLNKKSTKLALCMLQDSDLAHKALAEAREEVIKLISQASVQRQVISVWGEDGSQNTDLVRIIYDGKELDSNKFQRRAWITLSRPTPDQVSLVLELKAGSPVSEHNLETMEELIQELAKLLQNHKYLVILDGLSVKEEWELLVKHLPRDENASRIVVSTTEQSVAEHCSGSGKRQNTYKLDVHKVDDDNNENKVRAQQTRLPFDIYATSIPRGKNYIYTASMW